MFGREPAIVLGAISEMIKAVIPTLIIFGIIDWSGDQVAQVMFMVSVMVSAITVIWTRQQVVPTVKLTDTELKKIFKREGEE